MKEGEGQGEGREGSGGGMRPILYPDLGGQKPLSVDTVLTHSVTSYISSIIAVLPLPAPLILLSAEYVCVCYKSVNYFFNTFGSTDPTG